MNLLIRFAVVVSCLTFSQLAQADKYDGLYWVEFYPSQAMGDFNIPCVGGRGHMEIINSLIVGSVISDQLLSFEVDGQINEFGTIQGGMAMSQGVLASYEGRHRTKSGRGRWKTDNGCAGRWRAKQATQKVHQRDRIQIYEGLQDSVCSESVVDCLSETRANCGAAIKTSIDNCQTLIKLDPTEMQAKHISQCITKEWVRELRIPNGALKTCLGNLRN